MKKPIKITALLLAALLLTAPLSACGGSSAGNTPSGADGGTVWDADFTALPQTLQYINAEVITADGLYLAAEGTAEDESDSAPFAIYRVSADGGTCEMLPNYVPMTLPEGSEGHVSVAAMCADPEGNLWVAESAYSYHYDLPADFSGSEADKDQYYVSDGQRYTLRRLSADGAELATVDLTGLSEDSDYFYIQNLACDAAGNVYFSDGNTMLYVYGSDGAPRFTLEVSSYITNVIALSDGTVAAGSYGQDGFELLPADAQTKSWGTAVAISYPDQLYSGAGDYYFLYTSSSSLYGYNKETGESQQLFGWLDCDVDQSAIQAVSVGSDGGFLCLATQEDGSNLVAISEKPASEMPQKTTLTLAALSLDDGIRKQILAFNRASDTCRITVRDYSEYAVDGDYEAALTKLNTEIISGNVPDLLDVTQLPVAQYAGLGLLEDLYPYLDGDGELTRDSLIPSVLKALEVNGGLYQVSPSFGVFTVIGRSDVVGDTMGWTMDEMTDCLAAQPEGTELFQQGLTKDTMLEYICYMYLNSFVDWQTASCTFDTPEFASLLAFCNTFPATFDYDADTYESEVDRIQSGRQLLEITAESDFESFQMYEAMFGGKIVYKGFPRPEGVGNVAFVNTGLAMTTACADKDEAWRFMRTFLTEDYQTGGDIWSFPTNQAAFDDKLAEAMEKETYTDENGNEVEQSKGSWGWDDLTVEIYALTEEQAARMRSLVDSVDGLLTFDTNIYDIISDETAGYFAGTKDAEETAKGVQSRVSLYVSEQA